MRRLSHVVSVIRPGVVVLVPSPVVVDAPVVTDVTDSRDWVDNHIRIVNTRSCDVNESESYKECPCPYDK